MTGELVGVPTRSEMPCVQHSVGVPVPGPDDNDQFAVACGVDPLDAATTGWIKSPPQFASQHPSAR
jgi:hypothetical protein